MYQATDNLKATIITASGQWSGEFTIRNLNDENDIITCVAASPPAAPLQISDIAVQDPWETRNAWKDVLAALVKGDMQKIIKEKTKLKEAQRAMRRKEAAEGVKWEPKFFSSTGDDGPAFCKLAMATGRQLHAERTKGVWRFDREKAEKATKPYIMATSHHSDE